MLFFPHHKLLVFWFRANVEAVLYWSNKTCNRHRHNAQTWEIVWAISKQDYLRNREREWVLWRTPPGWYAQWSWQTLAAYLEAIVKTTSYGDDSIMLILATMMPAPAYARHMYKILKLKMNASINTLKGRLQTLARSLSGLKQIILYSHLSGNRTKNQNWGKGKAAWGAIRDKVELSWQLKCMGILDMDATR